MDWESLETAEAQGQGGGQVTGGDDPPAETSADGTTANGPRRWSDEEWRQWNENRGNSWSWGYDNNWGRSYWGNGWQTGSFATYAAASASTGPAGQSGVIDPGDRQREGELATQQPPWMDRGWNNSQRPWWGVQQKGDFADPPAWGGWQHYRLWKKAVSRWNNGTDVSMFRRAEKLLKGFDWELQSKFEHVPEDVLSSSDYLTVIFQVMDAIAGEKETSERRRSIRAALYEGARRSDESLSQYSLQRESQFSGAEKFLALPDELKAFMLEEQSGLSKQGIQNLRVLTGGRHSFDEVKRALRILDAEEESLFKASKTNYFMDDEQAPDDEDSPDDEDIEAIFLEIEKEDMTEEAAMTFLAEYDNKKRKSWQDNRLLKAARKKDRRHFDDPTSRAGKPRNRREMTTAELKKITRCGNCLQKGHWHEECKNPYKPRDQPHRNFGKDKNAGGANAFAYFGQAASSSGEGSGLNYLIMLHNNVFLGEDQSSWNFLAIPPGHAIVDPGASQDLIGEPAFLKLKDRLKSYGLQPVVLEEKPPPAAGVGGKARPLYVALVPCALGGHPGVLKVTILSEDIPQLLSIGLLEHGKAVIDTDLNTISFKTFGCQADMTRMESGHRLLDIADWSNLDFVLPEQVSQEYGLKEPDFKVAGVDVSSKSLYEGASGMDGIDQGRYLSHLFSCISDSSQSVHVVDLFGNSAFVSQNVLEVPLEELSQQHGHEFRSTWIRDGSSVINIEREAKGDMQVICDTHSSLHVAIVFYSREQFKNMREVSRVTYCLLEPCFEPRSDQFNISDKQFSRREVPQNFEV